MMHLTLTTVLTAFASLAATLFIMHFLAHILQARITNLNACFVCVLSTSIIMAGAIQFTPDSGLEKEHIQFLIAVGISTFIYSAFLNTTLIKSMFLAATNFMIQILTLLGFSLAVGIAQAASLF